MSKCFLKELLVCFIISKRKLKLIKEITFAALARGVSVISYQREGLIGDV